MLKLTRLKLLATGCVNVCVCVCLIFAQHVWVVGCGCSPYQSLNLGWAIKALKETIAGTGEWHGWRIKKPESKNLVCVGC